MRKTIGVIIAVLILLSVGCGTVNIDVGVERAEVGELQRTSQVVELARVDDLGDGSDLRVLITMGAGELDVDGGADELLEAEFAYNILEWAPEIEVQNGRLQVAQPSSRNMPFNEEVRYEWDLSFNDTVPMLFRAEIGAGSGDLDLGSLRVRTVDLKLGAGDMTVDLNGNRTLERLDADLGAGQFDLDLRGDWEQDVDVNVRGGLGETTIQLPQNIGVRVRVDKGLGSVSTQGLTRDGNDYVNSLYGESEVTLYVSVQAGIGEVNLIGE
ncbi:MAG: toast rack family protein [Anaerolineae bacterium]|jgi:hypothetical protein|nr:toast rack family protein [Anaerolineae bacterium]